MSCKHMFGSIIYVLYLYVWSIINVHPFVCLQDINDTPKHKNTRHLCLVFVCLGVSFKCTCITNTRHKCLGVYLCLVFVCLGVSFMSCICMFGSIIYVLYLYTSLYDSIIYVLYLYVYSHLSNTRHMILTNTRHLCTWEYNHIYTPKHTNTRHK